VHNHQKDQFSTNFWYSYASGAFRHTAY